MAAAAILPGVVALGICAYQLSLPNVLFGVHLESGNPYDDGVYFGAALRLVHGVIPYRDFILVHPPGIVLLMAPLAALGRAIGTGDGLAAARIATALVAGLNSVLAAIAVRHRGVGAMALAGTALACFPLAVAADHTLLLEPYLVLFCLIGAVAMFSDGELAFSRRLVLAGVAFGFAGAIKIWAIVPILVAIAVCLPHWRKLRLLVLGMIAGFAVPCLPFFISAPHAFFHDVFVDQLAHAAPGAGGIPASERVLLLTGILAIKSPYSLAGVAALIVVAFLVFVVVVYTRFARWTRRADWFVLGSAVGATAIVWFPNHTYDHYMYFPAAFLAMLFGCCVFRAVESRASINVGVFRRLGAFAVPAVISLVVILTMVPVQAHYAKGYLRYTPNLSPVLAKVIPPGACVVADVVTFTILANRFDPATRDCPALVDPTGIWIATFPAHLPPYSGPYPQPFVAEWGRWLNQASYVVLAAASALPYIPLTPKLESWLGANFKVTYTQPGLVVYKHVGDAPPP